MADHLQGLLSGQADLKILSPLTLAFVGDAVFSLLVRQQLALHANRPAGALHYMSVKRVNAGAQAKAYERIADQLTKEEQDVYRRGRNAHTPRSPKGATLAEYHSATGLEALFGYLYLKNETGRIMKFFSLITEEGQGNTTTE